MHLNRRESSDALMRINGSVAFGAAARSVLLLARDAEDPEGLMRLLAHAKSNLGVESPTLRQRVEGREVTADDGTIIKTSGIAWIGEAKGVRAGDLVQAPPDEEERSALEEAKKAVAALMKDGPVPAEEALSQLRAAGIRDRTAQRARAQLGVEARQANTH